MKKAEAIEILKHCGAESHCHDYNHGKHCEGCNQRVAQDMAIEALETEAIPVEWLEKEIKKYGKNTVYEVAGSLLLSNWAALQRKEE